MSKVLSREQIEEILPDLDILGAIEQGYAAYSSGRAVVPPVGELVFEDPPGETHIKYGYIRGQKYYVIKVGCGFYENLKLGLSTRNGTMIVLEQQTGRIAYYIDDQGLLTDVRTAAAGAVVAKYLAPPKVERIGIIGAGGQGRAQAEFLRGVIDCDDLIVWGVSDDELNIYKEDMRDSGFSITTTRDIPEIMETCSLVVTATPSEEPLITADMVRPGTHISAFGSDTPDKIELDPDIFLKADLVYVDSHEQSETRGEISHARKAGVLEDKEVHEIGEMILGEAPRRIDDDQFTVVDLTGVAVQDIEICRIVCEHFDAESH